MTNAQRDELLLKMDNRLEGMDKRFEGIDKRISNLEADMKEQKEYTRGLSQSIAVIEFDHGQKLQTLLDMYPEFVRKFESNNERFDSHEKRLDEYAFRMMRVEKKVGIN